MIAKNKLIYSIFLMLAIVMVSCEIHTRKHYYKNGNLKKVTYFVSDSNVIVENYDTTGTIEFREFFTHKKRDSIFIFNNGIINVKKYINPTGKATLEYDEKGILIRRGMYLHDTIKVGWWDFYKNNKTEAKREYVTVCDNQYLNQNIVFDKNGDTIYKKDNLINTTSFFKLRKVGDENFFRMYYDVRSFFSKGNRLELIFLNGSNCDEEMDTIIELKSNKGYVDLDNKYINKHGFFFDFYGYRNPKGSEAPYGIRHHRKYFDLKKVKLE